MASQADKPPILRPLVANKVIQEKVRFEYKVNSNGDRAIARRKKQIEHGIIKVDG